MSSCYRDPKISRAEQEERDADLRGYIENIRIDFPKSGCRTLMEYLRRQNVEVSEYRLRQVLAKFKLQIKVKRKNQVWVSDITYSTPSRSGSAGCRKEHTNMNGIRVSTKGVDKYSTVLCYERT